MKVKLAILTLLLTLVSCSPAKTAPTPQEKCDMTPGHEWVFSHTRRWYTYNYTYDSKGNLTGMIPVSHREDVYKCRERT